jgi:sporulation protein YlmC with PRC-barrel domain
MLRSLKLLEHYKVKATDGDLGSVTNFLLDDQRWTVRYLVVETGGIFGGRQVLISPISFRNVDFSARSFHLALTMDRIKNSPSVDLDKPVSRQVERDYYGYYGYPYYWGHGALWGSGYYPGAMAGAGYDRSGERPGEPDADVHLRSAKEVTGYHIEGTDGAIGHVKDFMLDDESWAIQYMVIETSNWWVGKSVLIAPEWTSRISWFDRKVYVDMTREAIKNSPQWGIDDPISRAYEEALYRHYDRKPLRRRSDAFTATGVSP